jgi:hypothetical protein
MLKKSSYTRELYAITKVIPKFKHHLFGHRFIIRTYEKCLHNINDQAIKTLEQQAMLHKLLGYDFIVEYKLGKENIPDDALSRSFLMAWSQPKFEMLSSLKKDVTKDE